VFKKVKRSKQKGSIQTAFVNLLSSTPTELDFEPFFEKEDIYSNSLWNNYAPENFECEKCACESKDTDVDDIPPYPLTWEEELSIANNNNPLPHDEFRELIPAVEKLVTDAAAPDDPTKVVQTAFEPKLDILKKDILSLVGSNWVNDQIINFYLLMLMERGGKSEEAVAKVYAFNSFFYNAFIKGNTRLKRWTKKVDIFEYDLILVPVHPTGTFRVRH
jgi:hypothetical protein